VVLDPVLVASSGERLLAADAVEALKRRLIPLARVVTPNLPEVAALLGLPVAADDRAIRTQAERLMALGCQAVLIKGGHGTGAESIDILFERGGEIRFAAPRIATRNTHGTGCTLSSAIAAGLAKGEDLATAVRAAKAFVTAAIAAADRLGVGQGPGPLHHFHAVSP
jgi:hydroxymethylpyrimidine/phosphomethylpyrimidine kinase